MAGLLLHATMSAEDTLVTDTARTILQIASPTDQRVKILAWGVYFSGTSASAEPVIVELCDQNQSIQTASDTITPQKLLDLGTETPRSTIREYSATGSSTEPGTSTVVKAINVHPQSAYEEQMPFGQEYHMPESSFFGIRCTAPAGVDVIAWMRFEE